jgi:murein DD-endopeptidase MepM/ murein hydrolase activator NlpD
MNMDEEKKPQTTEEPSVSPENHTDDPTPEKTNPANRAGRSTLHTGLNLLAAALLVVLFLLVGQRILAAGQEPASGASTEEAFVATPDASLKLSPLATPVSRIDQGILRKVNLKTIIPTRPRDNVITYTVNSGDNLFNIAENYGLKPETLLWGNYATLKDNPQLLTVGQVINILPVDGTYYQWQEGDTLEKVAADFKVDPQAILDYPGNHLNLAATDDKDLGVQPGDWLIVPGGTRPLKDWGPPAISRSNPAAARYYGPGYCGSVYAGAVGTGTYVWPTTEHFISGYYFSAIHHGVDIGGALGNAIFAADSGVVVYAGWSNSGYGNLIVIDHDGGSQTAYGHLSTIAVTCGQSVGQGTYIGAMGSTGNSTGPHLHFELIYNGVKVNPLDYIH